MNNFQIIEKNNYLKLIKRKIKVFSLENEDLQTKSGMPEERMKNVHFSVRNVERNLKEIKTKKQFQTSYANYKTSYNAEVFTRMLSKPALEKAQPYLKEEHSVLTNLMEETPQIKNMNFCVVGGGSFYYLQLAMNFAARYTLIEPHFNDFIDRELIEKIITSQDIEIFPINFESYCETIHASQPSRNTLYVFWFNVISYLKNPIDMINKIVKKGDILFFSSWHKSTKAHITFKKYFDYISINKNQYFIPPHSILHNLALNNIKNTSRIENINNKITDIRIVYT